MQMAAEAESPEYMTTLRAALEAAASEAGSGVSGDSTALARCHSSQLVTHAIMPFVKIAEIAACAISVEGLEPSHNDALHRVGAAETTPPWPCLRCWSRWRD